MSKILIVEDEQSYRTALEKKLAKSGYEIVSASDGIEALGAVKRHKPDLILLDIVMPKMSGFDFLESLRIKLEDQTPVMILTNLSKKDDVNQAKRFKVKHFISKSDSSLREVLALIANTLGTIK